MTDTAPAFRAIVLGGGILGVSTAYHLVQQGIAVTLVSDGDLASGASGRSLSWLNSSAIRSAGYHRLRMLGIDRYRALAAQQPGAAWLRFDGGLTWGTPEDEERLRAVLAHHEAVGYAAEWVMPDEVAALVPGVDVSAVPGCGAIFNPDEGWVDLPSVIALLVGEFVRLGGALVVNAGPAAVTTAGDRVTGARTGSGQVLEADVVVLATGADVPAALRRLGTPIGDASTAALLVRTQPLDVRLRAVLNTPRVSLRPAPDGSLVFDAEWAEQEVVPRDGGDMHVAHSTVTGLVAEASRVLAGNPRLSPVTVAAGWKPIPADGEPVLGAVDGIAGCHVAFSHSGATIGLAAGELLAGQIVSGRTHPVLAPYGPGRFLGGSPS